MVEVAPGQVTRDQGSIQLHGMEDRRQPGQHLGPAGEAVEREEGAAEPEHRHDEQAEEVGKLADRLRLTRVGQSEASEEDARQKIHGDRQNHPG